MKTLEGLFGLVACLSFLAAGSARAGQFEDSQANLAKSYNDFYKALQSTPNATAQDANRISSQTIDPAGKQLNKAIHDTTVQTVETIRKAYRPQPKPLPIPPGFDMKKSPWMKGGPNQPSVAQTPTPQNPSAYEHPKTVLDGSGIPREVDFSGPKKTDDGTQAPQH